MTSSTLAPTPPIKAPSTLRTRLSNGLTVIVTPNSGADIVSAHIFIKAGQAQETPQTAGLFTLLADVLVKGTEDKTSLQIAEAIESIGASFGSDVASDHSTVSLKTVSSDFEAVLALAAEVVRRPSFPQAEIDLEKRLILQSLRSVKEQPFSVAYNHLREALYAGHPYGLANVQTEKCLSEFTRQDMLNAHAQYFRPDNIVISIAGRLSPEQALQQVEKTFGDWSAPDDVLPKTDCPALKAAAQKIVTVQNTNQAFVIVGHLAAAVSHPDYAALKLISTYLGNGLSSRLFVELREKQGLAYDVSAFYPTRQEASQFVAYIGTAPENVPVALAGLQKEIDRLKTVLLSDEELQVSKNKILGQYALGKQTNSQIAQMLGWYEVLGLGIEFDEDFVRAIAAVTQADIQAAAQRHFVEQYLSILGPAAAVDPLK